MMNRKPPILLATRSRRPLLLPHKPAPKQTGDAAEYLIAGMMTLYGMPTAIMPENWPDYDLITQPPANGRPERISVKSRREQDAHKWSLVLTSPDHWDWFAFVLILKGNERPRCWLIPKEVILHGRVPYERGVRLVNGNKLEKKFARFEDNFTLRRAGRDGIVLKAA
jgi:hypothetical protein